MNESNAGPWRFLKNKFVLAASTLLVVQALAFFPLSTTEHVPLARPLKQIPQQIGAWTATREGVTEQEILDLLRADDTLDRSYTDTANSRSAGLFVAFYKSQRAGVSPHSPKVCLPGSGWLPTASSHIDVSIPGSAEPINVNRYEVSRGELRSVVLYWYQTNRRVLADEFQAKAYLMWDGLRYRRSDSSLVRVVVPVANGDFNTANQTAIDFVQAIFGPVREFLPK